MAKWNDIIRDTERPDFQTGSPNAYNQLIQDVQSMASANGLVLDETTLSEIIANYFPKNKAPTSEDLSKAMSLIQVDMSRRLGEKQTADIEAELNPTLTDQNLSDANAVLDKLGIGGDADKAAFIAEKLAEGSSKYEVEQFLRTNDPDYIKAQANIENERVKTEAAAARNELNTSLTAQTEEAYRRAMPGILSSYMKAGKLSSSGVDSAVAQAKAKLLQQQQQYMAGLQYEDAARQAGYSRENFLNQQNLGYQNQQQVNALNYGQEQAVQGYQNYAKYQSPWDSMNRQFALSDARTSREQSLQDYYMQRNDWQNAMNQQYSQQRQNLPYQLGGQILGAGLQGLAMGGFR